LFALAEITCNFWSANNSAGYWGAHCDAALNPMVFVDHVGKVFERIEATNLMDKTNDIETTLSAEPPYQASFCPRHGNHRIQGAFRNRRAGFFCYFSCPSRKVKEEKLINLV
jgi:hypothetical protein